MGLPWWLSGKELTCNAGDTGSIPGLGRSPGEGNGNTLQYSCLENSMDWGAWWATYSPWVAKSRTWLNNIISKWVSSLSRVRLFATAWTVAYQASPSVGFSRQEYWSVLPFPSPGDLPDPGIEPRSPSLEADALTSEPPGNNIIGNYKSHQ